MSGRDVEGPFVYVPGFRIWYRHNFVACATHPHYNPGLNPLRTDCPKCVNIYKGLIEARRIHKNRI